MTVNISTITLSCAFPKCALNLTNIGKYLDIDDCIIGLKYKYADLDVMKGKYSTTIYKKAKLKDPNKINKSLFYNQITMIVNNRGNHVNVKLFGNGSLHLTGCKSIDESKDIVQLLYRKLDALRNKQDTILLTKDINNVLVDKDNLIYSHSSHQVIGYYKKPVYMINKREYTIDQKTHMFISMKMETRRRHILCNMDGVIIGQVQIELTKNKSKFYNRNTNIYYDYPNSLIYYNNDVIIGKILYNYDESKVTKEITPDVLEILYDCNPFVDKNYYLNVDDDQLGSCIDVDVNCMNVFFTLDYKLNRNKLYDFLISSQYICKYKPESYSGIKLIFKVPIDFTESNSDISSTMGHCSCTTKCTCKNITFLIFQSGNVIATGFKTYIQIHEITKHFNTLMTTVRPQIEMLVN